jgi:hypothetical protein
MESQVRAVFVTQPAENEIGLDAKDGSRRWTKIGTYKHSPDHPRS